MKIAVTGHRPDKVPSYRTAMGQLKEAFEEVGATYVYQGMAEGADLLAARGAYESGIPFAAVKPWKGHTVGIEWQVMHHLAWEYADEKVWTADAEEFPGNWAYHRRNKYMVDNADAVIAYWDGSGVGGTFATLTYAQAKGKPVYKINPQDGVRLWLPE